MKAWIRLRRFFKSFTMSADAKKEMMVFQDLRENVYCRLRPSLVDRGGVGVFAIRDIPVGCNPFGGLINLDQLIKISASAFFADTKIDPKVKKMAQDFSVFEGDCMFYPRQGLNEIGISWFINTSKDPNLREKGFEFFALRDIKDGEELTVDYDTYSDI